MSVPPDAKVRNRAVVNTRYWLKQLSILTAVLIAAYISIVLLLRSPLYEAIVLRPSPPANGYDLARQLPGFSEYFIPARDGNRIHAWLFKPSESRTLVIVHHGNAGNIVNRLYLARAITACGTAAFLYDYRGYGKSGGNPSLPGLIEDGRTVYDFARDGLGYCPTSIINMGESIGTGVACSVASDRPSAGLVLQSAVGSLPRVAKAGIAWLNIIPSAFFPQPQFDNVEQIKQVHVPVLLFHGTADHIVPCQHSKLILANCNAPRQLILVQGAGHNDMPAEGQLYRGALRNFLNGVNKQSAKTGH